MFLTQLSHCIKNYYHSNWAFFFISVYTPADVFLTNMYKTVHTNYIVLYLQHIRIAFQNKTG